MFRGSAKMEDPDLRPAGNMRGLSISLSCSLAITNCGFFSQVRPGSPLIRKGCGGVGSLNLDCLVSGADMTCDNTRYSLRAPFNIFGSVFLVKLCGNVSLSCTRAICQNAWK